MDLVSHGGVIITNSEDSGNMVQEIKLRVFLVTREGETISLLTIEHRREHNDVRPDMTGKGGHGKGAIASS